MSKFLNYQRINKSPKWMTSIHYVSLSFFSDDALVFSCTISLRPMTLDLVRQMNVFKKDSC